MNATPGFVTGRDLREFGSNVATGDVAADTAALEAAWATMTASATSGRVTSSPTDQYDISRSTLLLPPGSITYSGTGLTDAGITGFAGRFAIRGAHCGTSEVRLSNAAGRLVDIASAALTRFELADFQVRGGAGLFRHQRTADNIFGDLAFRRLVLRAYTGCAIEWNSQNMPYVIVDGCVFRGADTLTTMGVALSGIANGSRITGNRFLLNRVHVKLRRGGNDVYLDGNDWLRFVTDRTNGPCTDLWLVPSPDYPGNGAGAGTHITRSNKFGNENFLTGDYKILVADEATGANNGVQWPDTTTASAGYVEGITAHPTIYGASTALRSPIYSTCPNLYGWDVDLAHRGTTSLPDYLIELSTAALTAAAATYDPLRATNRVALTGAGAGVSTKVVHSSNLRGLAASLDPGVQLAASASAPMGAAAGGSAWGDYSNILAGTTGVTGFTSGGGVSKTGVSDSFGGSGAESVEVTFVSGGTLLGSLSSGAMTAGRQAWVEGLIRQGAAGTMTRLGVRMQDTTGNVYWQRVLDVPADAVKVAPFRFPFRPPVTGGAVVFYVVDPTTDLPGAGGTTGTVRLERVRVYQSREPVQLQPRKEPLELQAGLKLREGTADARQGVATLVAGTVTVSTTAVTANSRIMLTPQTGIAGAIGLLGVTARTAGTSFVITARDATGTTVTNDTRQVAWVLLEPMP